MGTRRFRFGAFEFEPESGELRRDGTLVKLQAQPARVLAVLIENAGQTVPREDLRSAVWEEKTFVDFDGGLNFCIAQVRSALGDSAESPRFIRTVPRKGYQFIAPLAAVDAAPGPQPVRAGKRRATVAIAAAAVVLAGLAAMYWQKSRGDGRPIIAVARFDADRTEHTGFADGLTDSIVAEWAAAGDASQVIGNAALLREPRGRRDPAEIGRRLGARYVVLGQVLAGEPGLRVLAHLIRLPEQTHVKVVRAEVPAGADPGVQQAEIGRRIVSEFRQAVQRDGSSPPPAR
jgi:DNA-binding winged helix-turn-helix (wHTH) protein